MGFYHMHLKGGMLYNNAAVGICSLQLPLSVSFALHSLAADSASVRSTGESTWLWWCCLQQSVKHIS